MVSKTEEWLSFCPNFLIERAVAVFALLTVIGILIIDLIVPSWAVSVVIVSHYVFMLYGGIVKPVRDGWSIERLLIFSSVGWYVVILPSLWTYASPRKQLLVYWYLAQILPCFLHRTWVYLQIDGSSQTDDSSAWAVQRELLVVYGACSYVFTHRNIWWPTSGLVSLAFLILVLRGRWRYSDSQLPPIIRGVCAVVLAGYLMKRLHIRSDSVSRFAYTISFTIFTKYGSLDQIRLWEAQLFAQLPEYLARRWSKYQQTHPLRKELPKFEYRPLGDNEIRVLILRPPKWLFGTIEARILHRPIDQLPNYEAVSYCWGSDQRTEEILIDGCRFAVTKSAFDLLLARRSIWRYRTIWIDAICINQDCKIEKNAQVHRMREIYHKASRVIVFTGSNWHARYVVPLILKIVTAPSKYGFNDWSSMEVFPYETGSPRWKALYELFENVYFTRIWIIQEVAVARKVELYYGDHYLEWETVLTLFDLILGPNRRDRFFSYGTSENQRWVPPQTVKNIEIMSLFRPDSGEKRASAGDEEFYPDWEHVLFVANKFQSSEDKDKVFALLGLATNINHVESLRPDYYRTTEQVYEDATRAVIFPKDGQPSIHLLALAGTGYSKERKCEALPSWVPDFSESRASQSYTDLLARRRRYFASGMSSPVITAGPGPDCITLMGVVVDSVLALNASGPLEYPFQNRTVGVEEDIISQGKLFFRSVVELCNKYASQWSIEDLVSQRLWMVLIGGYINYERPDPHFKDIFYAIFKALGLVDKDHEISAEDDESFKQEISRYVAKDSYMPLSLATADTAAGRRFGITSGGRLCLLPPFSRDGDKIFIPLGAQTPFAIREHPTNNAHASRRWEVVGEAFVEGLMDGEGMGEKPEVSLVFA